MPGQKRIEHEVGEQIGECFFISYAPNDRFNTRRVNVKCRCGNVFEARYSAIKIGRTKSCGCLQRESASNQAKKYEQGQMFGDLTFLNRAGMDADGESSLGNFLCVCGKEFITRIYNVKCGATKSCGCLTSKFIVDAHTKHDAPKKVLTENGRTSYKLIPVFTEETFVRFWSKVDLKANPFICWNWTGTGQRYGSFNIGKALYKSNRVAYFLHYGKDPKEMEVMHSCDNPKCCNPSHLSLGDHFENMQDMKEKGRANPKGRKACRG